MDPRRSADHFAIAAITVAELWHGLERADERNRTNRSNYLTAILKTLPIIPYTEAIAYRHAKIWADLVKSGKMIESHDLIIAATALERGDAVATLNVRHFCDVTGLTIIDPKTEQP